MLCINIFQQLFGVMQVSKVGPLHLVIPTEGLIFSPLWPPKHPPVDWLWWTGPLAPPVSPQSRLPGLSLVHPSGQSLRPPPQTQISPPSPPSLAYAASAGWWSCPGSRPRVWPLSTPGQAPPSAETRGTYRLQFHVTCYSTLLQLTTSLSHHLLFNIAQINNFSFMSPVIQYCPNYRLHFHITCYSILLKLMTSVSRHLLFNIAQITDFNFTSPVIQHCSNFKLQFHITCYSTLLKLQTSISHHLLFNIAQISNFNFTSPVIQHYSNYRL